jgi:hypothetical protein
MMIPLTIWVIYTSFLVFGAVAGEFVDHIQLRLVLAIAFAFVFPFVTGASAFTQHSAPRFEERMRRLLSIVLALSLGSSILIALFVGNKAVPNLKNQPNWFMSQPSGSFAEFNRSYSNKIASIVSKTAR